MAVKMKPFIWLRHYFSRTSEPKDSTGSVDSTKPEGSTDHMAVAMAVDSTEPKDSTGPVASTEPVDSTEDDVVSPMEEEEKCASREHFVRRMTTCFEEFEKELAESQKQVGYTAMRDENKKALHSILQLLMATSPTSPAHPILQVQRWSTPDSAKKNGWDETDDIALCSIYVVGSCWDKGSHENLTPDGIHLTKTFVANVNNLLRRRYGTKDYSSLRYFANASRFSRMPIPPGKLTEEVLGFVLFIRTKDQKMLCNTEATDRDLMSQAFEFHNRENILNSSASEARAAIFRRAKERICTFLEDKKEPAELVELIRREDLKFPVLDSMELTRDEKDVVKSCFKDTSADNAIINNAAKKLWDYFHKLLKKKQTSRGITKKEVVHNNLRQDTVVMLRYKMAKNTGTSLAVITRISNANTRWAKVSFKWLDDNLRLMNEYKSSSISIWDFQEMVVSVCSHSTEQYRSNKKNQMTVRRDMQRMMEDLKVGE